MNDEIQEKYPKGQNSCRELTQIEKDLVDNAEENTL